MTFFIKLAGASVALALTLSASAAGATIITATYTGTVVGFGTGQEQILLPGVSDDTGEFGGGAIDQAAFTAVFKFDTSLGIFDPTAPNLFLGGSDFSQPDPVISAVLTINNVDQAFSGVTSDYALLANLGPDNFSFHQVNELSISPSGSVSRFLIGQFFNPALPLDLRTYFSGDRAIVNDANQAFGEFLIYAEDADHNLTHQAYGYLAADHLTLTSDAVPEAGTWVLMLLGFGSVGAAVRRNRRASV